MDNTFLKRSLKIRNRNRIVGLVVLVITAAITYAAVLVPLGRDLSAEYSETQGTAISEGTVRVLEGTRRSKHWADRRTVTFEFELNGEKRTDSVRSTGIQVGETRDLWVEDDGERPEIFLEPKAGPHWGLWVGFGVGSIVVFGLVAGLSSSFRMSQRIKSADLLTRQPLLELEVFEVRSKIANEKRKATPKNIQVQVFGRVTHSASSDISVGTEYVFQNLQVEMPQEQLVHLDASPIKERALSGDSFVRVHGTNTWWIARMEKREHTIEFKAHS